MPASPLLPALDPAPVPGPPWLIHVLWVVTFLVHLLFVNAVLGGSLLSTIALLLGKKVPGRSIASFFVEVNSWALSLAITFGIAPLLFVQVLYGRLFYSATVLMAPIWLGLLVLLTAGYYLNYVASFRYRKGRDATLPVALSALLFLAIAAIQVAVHLLHAQPGRWTGVNASLWSAFADPSFLPRFLHFVLAAVTLAAVAVAWLAVRKTDEEDPDAGIRARFGVAVALGATALQVIDGFWLLLSLPRPVLKQLMKGGAAVHIPLDVGILIAIGILVVLARIRDPREDRKLVRRAVEMIVLAILLMVITRHQVRDAYLTVAGAGEMGRVEPQWGVFAVFLVSFVGCLYLTIHAVARALKDRSEPGERAA